MAVLHHAFRCPVTREFEREISNLLAAWDAGDQTRLSAVALAGYESLAQREDVQAAFHLAPDGAVSSWLQPEFISPGLAALTVLAHSFIPLPGLSASGDTNHDLLATQLPALGWSDEETGLLVRGQPIEVMLRGYTVSTRRLEQGGFQHTGGWTPGRMARKLGARLDQLAVGIPPDADEAARAAWLLLDESNALQDARAMLAPLTDDDWLVTAITH